MLSMPTLHHLFTLKLGGAAGQGIKSIGLTFSRICTRSGYYIYNYTEYPSLIRGGHNMMQTTVSADPINSPTLHTSLLIALNQDTVNLHHQEMVDGGIILFDKDAGITTDQVSSKINIVAIPLAKLAQDVGGKAIMANTVAMGATMALLKGNLQHFKDLLTHEFADKPKEVAEINHKAAQAGYDFALKNFSNLIKEIIPQRQNQSKQMVISGNEACAFGAISAGVQFAAMYPMTPATNILHNMAPHQEKFGFIYKQPEDEIAALQMAIGAANAGARSMTATSGGGFCLMQEGVSLAGMTETPVVIINVMRNAPATAMPTWSEQGDLRLVLHSGHGDFPRIVLAAGDAKECFELTQQAFNLAEKYQTPVILLSDKIIAENDQSFELFSDKFEVERGKYSDKKIPDYKRYELTDEGISLRVPLGSGNFFIANSDEHDELGFSMEEIAMRNSQMEKRNRKLEVCRHQDMPEPILYGAKDADVTIVSWGSNKGSIIDALRYYPNVNYLHLTWINPFPIETVKQVLGQAKYKLNIEQNYGAQMAGWIAEQTGIRILDNLLKYDGRPIYPEEIMEKLDSILGH